MSDGLTLKLQLQLASEPGATVRMIFLEIFREVDVRLENNASQISWQSDENCVSN